MIEVKDLSYRYANGTVALSNINMELPKEHILAILGKSGSGKTTLLKCLGRFLHPSEGKILFNDNNINDFPERKFRQLIGIVFQKLYLFPHLSVLQNMTLAPHRVLGKDLKTAEDEARSTLARLDIADIADSYPSQISGGQAQRAAIARGLLLKPEYLLLDEPTSSLDINTTDDFASWLVHLKAKTTFIIVTHDVLFARKVATRGILLSGGRVTDSGKINSIIDKLGVRDLDD